MHEEKTTDAKPAVPRNFYIQARNLETHGYPAGFPGMYLDPEIGEASPTALRSMQASEVKAANGRITEQLATMLEKADEELKAKRGKNERSDEPKREDMRDVVADKGE